MIKKMVINIDIDTENHTSQMVKKNVTIDGKENFKIGTGFIGDMAKKFI